jgi:hypothetical protein
VKPAPQAAEGFTGKDYLLLHHAVTTSFLLSPLKGERKEGDSGGGEGKSIPVFIFFLFLPFSGKRKIR